MARVVKKKAVEDRNVDIYADGTIPARDMVVADGRLPDNTEGGNSRPPEIMLSTAEFLRRLYSNCRALISGRCCNLLNQRSNVRGRNIEWTSLFDKLEILLVGVTENRRGSPEKSGSCFELPARGAWHAPSRRWKN